MNTEIKLDEWDFQLILIFKRSNGLDIFDQLRFLWGERNAIDSKHIRLIDVAYELEKIRSYICEQNKNIRNTVFELLNNASPYKQDIYWRDFNPIIEQMGHDKQHWARVILAYGPVMRFCESSDLPPEFSDYFNNVWLKAGKP